MTATARLSLAAGVAVAGIVLGFVVGWPASIYIYYGTIGIAAGLLGMWSVLLAQVLTSLAMFGLPLALAIIGFRYVWKRR
jgi:hypothetical protein